MPLYPMQCAVPSFKEAQETGSPIWCGHTWDWHARLGVYQMSKNVDFRNVLCPRCGRRGAHRIYPAAAVPTSPKCQGTWGASAPKGLRGKSYVTKEERDEQFKAFGDAGQVIMPTEGRGEFKKSGKSETRKPAPTRAWEETMTVPVEPPRVEGKAEDLIVQHLKEHGPQKRGDLISALDINPSTLSAALRASKTIKRVSRGVYGV